VLEVLAVLVVEESGLPVAGDLRLNDSAIVRIELIPRIEAYAVGKSYGWEG
jgi:hypothetical protein